MHYSSASYEAPGASKGWDDPASSDLSDSTIVHLIGISQLCGTAVVNPRQVQRSVDEEKEFVASLPVVQLARLQPKQHVQCVCGHEPVLWPSVCQLYGKAKTKRNARLADGVWSEMLLNEYALVLLSRFLASRL